MEIVFYNLIVKIESTGGGLCNTHATSHPVPSCEYSTNTHRKMIGKHQRLLLTTMGLGWQNIFNKFILIPLNWLTPISFDACFPALIRNIFNISQSILKLGQNIFLIFINAANGIRLVWDAARHQFPTDQHYGPWPLLA